MTRRDTVWILSFLISGALGLACYVQFFDRAFPVASLNFRVDREQAYQAAEAYIHRLGYDLTEYESAQIFSHASLPQIFLERTLGLAEANRLVREWVSVWYWNIRYFKPLQKEELRVRIDPGGRIVGFTHSILESDEGTSLSEEDARHIAEAFLADVQGFSLDAYEPIEASSIDRPKRRDHTFTYRKRDFVVGDDGHYRLYVTVQGDRVGGFSEYLKVPETFSRDYREIRSRAGLLTKVAGGFSLALAIAMIVVLVRKYRQRTLTWRVAVFIGILVGAVSLLGSINGYPLSLFGYDTMQSYVSFILNFIFTGLLSAAVMALIVAVCGAAGGTIAQDVRNWSNPLERVSLRHWRSASFARVTLVGYGLAFAHLGYVTLFYILGNDYLGVWSPAAMTQYSNAYSTYLPWIYPLLTGLVAATMEEFLFRLVAISLLLRWLKRSWLALLVSAAVWAFLHADYPQEPIYIRGLELTIVGILLGIVFLRFGVWATIISHYVYNCFLGVYPMVPSTSRYRASSLSPSSPSRPFPPSGAPSAAATRTRPLNPLRRHQRPHPRHLSFPRSRPRLRSNARGPLTTSSPARVSSYLASSVCWAGPHISLSNRGISLNTHAKRPPPVRRPSRLPKGFGDSSDSTSKAIVAPPHSRAVSVPTTLHTCCETSMWRGRTRSRPSTRARGAGVCAGSSLSKKRSSPLASMATATSPTSRMPCLRAKREQSSP